MFGFWMLCLLSASLAAYLSMTWPTITVGEEELKRRIRKMRADIAEDFKAGRNRPIDYFERQRNHDTNTAAT